MILFYLFAAVAVGASLLVIGQRNPIYSVLLLILSFGALSGLYVLLDAPFVAVIQIVVYAGAIMVLFLFVVMLLNAPRETEADERRHLLRSGPLRFGAFLTAALAFERLGADPGVESACSPADRRQARSRSSSPITRSLSKSHRCFWSRWWSSGHPSRKRLVVH